MPKILITGSNGLLGQKLVFRLLKDGNYDVIGTSKGPDRLNIQHKKYTYRSLDITEKEVVLQVFSEEKPDFIVNTAAMTNVDLCETERESCLQLNTEAVAHIIEAAELNNSFLLQLSTDFIFDGTDGPYDEDAAPAPVNFYGESKLRSEKLLKKSTINWAIARTVLVYGTTKSMSRSNLVLWVRKKLKAGEEIRIVNDQWRTPTSADDLAEGCYLIIKNKAEGIFNISGEELLTPYEIAVKTADFFNLDRSLIEIADSSTFTQPAKRPPKTGFILAKAKSELGYRPHTFQEGLQILSAQL